VDAPIYLAIAASLLLLLLAWATLHTAVQAVGEARGNPSVDCMLLAVRNATVAPNATSYGPCLSINGTVIYLS